MRNRNDHPHLAAQHDDTNMTRLAHGSGRTLTALRPNIEDLNGIPYHSRNCCRPYIGDFTEPRCRYVQRVVSRLGPSACATNVVSPLLLPAPLD